MKNRSGLKRIFNDLETFFDPARNSRDQFSNGRNTEYLIVSVFEKLNGRSQRIVMVIVSSLVVRGDRLRRLPKARLCDRNRRLAQDRMPLPKLIAATKQPSS